MTTKTSPCIARAGVQGATAVEASRGLHDGSPKHEALTGLVRQPWSLRLSRDVHLFLRGTEPRDLWAVAAMHRRCSAQSLLDRYRRGGRGPSVAALERMLRRPLSFIACTSRGEVTGMAVACIDALHGRETAQVDVLVADHWQGRGIGRELIGHLAGAALVCGYHELIVYTATTVAPAQRLMVEVGHTRLVADRRAPHLHTYVPESAALGLGAVRERLAS